MYSWWIYILRSLWQLSKSQNPLGMFESEKEKKKRAQTLISGRDCRGVSRETGKFAVPQQHLLLELPTWGKKVTLCHFENKTCHNMFFALFVRLLHKCIAICVTSRPQQWFRDNMMCVVVKIMYFVSQSIGERLCWNTSKFRLAVSCGIIDANWSSDCSTAPNWIHEKIDSLSTKRNLQRKLNPKVIS